MKAKLLTLILLTAIVLIGIASAATFTVIPITLGLSKSVNSVSFNVDNSAGTAAVTVPQFADISDGFGNTIVLTQSFSGNVAIGATQTVQVSYATLPTKLALGLLPSKTINVTDGTTSKIVTLSFNNEFCSAGVVGESYKLDIKKVKLNNVGYGEEDNEWYPLDSIEIELTIENNGDEDIDDVNIELCLYNPDEECIMDEDDMELSDNDFKIKDGDEEKVSITFELDPDELSDETDYTLYIKVYSDDLGENVLCTEESEDITVMIDKHFVILNNLEIPETVSCGEEVQITADAWNIGEEDEDDVYVKVYNKELGIDSRVDIGSIDALDKEVMTYALQVPENAEEKSYNLRFSVYDEDDDIFENDNEDKSEFVRVLKVEGACKKPAALKSAEITAVLETEEVKAGQEVKIRATIKNTGEEETTYTIEVDGYEFFSTFGSKTPSVLTLGAGKSADVLITLNLNKDAAGEQIFNIKAIFNGEEVKQAFSFSVSPGIGITGSAIRESLGNNWFIWVIVIINIILIIAIIIVAVRMSKA